MSKKTKNSQ